MLKHIKPKEGLLVRNPATNPPLALPPEGKVVEYSSYWERRRLDGDITVSEPLAENEKQPGKETAKGGGAADNGSAAAGAAAGE